MRKAQFEHLGGPYDGVFMPVPVDEHGVPVDSYLFNDMTDTDMRRDPSTSLLSDRATSIYERDERVDSDGIRYVFVFRGQSIVPLFTPRPRAA